jgi:hypothetical protein
MLRHVLGPFCARWVGGSFACFLLFTTSAQAVDVPDGVTRVEEDWELVVSDPDDDYNSPQITCTMTPSGGTGGLHVTFELNHRTQPDYINGGMQLQMWCGETFWGVSPGAWNYSLHHDGEVVRWTQRMKVTPTSLTFEVDNGESESWGDFGGGGNLSVTSAASLANLSGYSPDVSAALSGVGFGSTRVSSLKIKRIRYYAGDELVATDYEDRVVHQQN